jgi:predicted O-methyltransferase YrrM
VLRGSATLRREMRALAQLRCLPPNVALFQWRARRLARRAGDEFALVSGTRPHNLALLLSAASGRRRVVELGTGSGWTAVSLVLADRTCEVVSYDPIIRPERDRYFRLANWKARERLQLVSAPGDQGPRDSRAVDLLYIDSAHEREETIREVRTWLPALSGGSLIVFDDFGHPEYPGVEEAVRHLGLKGEQRGSLFIHQVSSELKDIDDVDVGALDPVSHEAVASRSLQLGSVRQRLRTVWRE